MYQEQLLITRQKQEADNEKRIRDAEMNIELQKKQLQFNTDKELYEMETRVKKQGELQKLKKAEFETSQLELKN